VQESALFIGMVEALGGSPTPMSFGEVYSALQTGVVDGAENNLPSYVSTGHYEVAPNYTLDGHSLVPDVLYVNAGVLEGLCEEDRTMVEEVAAESADFQREKWSAAEEEALKTIEDAGVSVVEVEDKSVWQDAVAPLTEEYTEQYTEQLAAIDAAR
jgi:TRAP-type C4-dicarboxylate transport system substrate-binding protein